MTMTTSSLLLRAAVKSCRSSTVRAAVSSKFTNVQCYKNNNITFHTVKVARSFHASSFQRSEAETQVAETAATSTSTSTSTSTNETPQEVEDVFQKILALDVIEVNLLQQLINEKLGITISESDLRGGGGGGGGAAGANANAGEDAGAPVEEKTAFELKLTGFDAKSKIKVIKEIRSMTGLGLKEAKELVEGAPKTIKKDIKKEEAEELKAVLEAVGATVDIL